ncbi:MAG: peptidoglycan -binding protein [Rhodobacteraceae bacterium]|nr:peptidoglycan -binding protein [Paracoccaceae bacterium]
MALARRTGHRVTTSIWTGFVDAMTGLLLVLMFVLSMFMIVQFILSGTIATQSSELIEREQRIENLSQLLTEKDSELAQLIARINQLIGDIETGSRRIAVLEAEVADQSLQLAEAAGQSAQIADLSAERDRLRTQILNLQSQLTSSNERIATLVSDLESVSRGAADSEAIANEELRQQSELIADFERQVVGFRRQLEALLADLETSLAAKRELEGELALAASEKIDQSNRIASLNDALSASQAEERRQAERITDLHGQVEELQALIASVTVELAEETQLSSTLQTRMEEERNRALAAESAHLQALQDIEELKIQLGAASGQAEEDRERFADFQSEIDSLESRISNLLQGRDKAESALAELQSELTETQQERDRVLIEAEEAQTGLLALTVELDEKRREAEKTLELLAAAQEAERILTTRLSERGQSLEQVEKELQEQLQLLIAAELVQQELRAMLEQSLRDAEEANAKLETVQAERGKLAGEVETAEAEAAVLRNRLGETEAELGNNTHRIAELLARLQDSRREIEAANVQQLADQEVISTVEAEAASLRSSLSETEAELQESQSRIAELLARLQDSRREIEAANVQQLADQEVISTVEAEAASLRSSLSETEAELQESQSRIADLLDEFLEIRSETAEANTKRAAALAAQEELAGELATVKAEAESQREQNRSRLAELTAALQQLRQENEKSMAELAVKEMEAVRIQEMLGDAAIDLVEEQQQVALLNLQVAELRRDLALLQSTLEMSETREAEDQVQIETLGSQLNAALARVAVEERRSALLEEEQRRRLESENRDLERFRSEFFGRMREVLEGREGVEVSGDRFLFSSEVLFESGDAELSELGKSEILSIARLILELAEEFPEDVDWVLRIDGHTDDRQVLPDREFANNWELSQARSLAVLLYLTQELGFPPERLAAAGFGEFRPLVPNASADARSRNRRIEFKLVEP